MDKFSPVTAAVAGNSGGGGGGTSDYSDLSNKPKINGVELSGNKSASDLSLVAAEDGKGLSTNDYTTAEKEKLAGLSNYTLPAASSSQLGGVKVGDNLSVDENGVLSATGGGDVTGVKGSAESTYRTGDVNITAENIGVEAGAQVNVIEAISVNGTEQAITDKKIELSIITNAVDNLINYYKKTETYTQTEVNNLISAAATGGFSVVSALPTTDISTKTIYLLPKTTSETNNVYDEYIYVNSDWELIGDTTIDLTAYQTKALSTFITVDGTAQTTVEGALSAINALFASYLKTSDFNTQIANYYTKTQVDNALSGKQDVIQYATMPTASADNEGKIVQYIGTTTVSYTNGFFYKCVEDSENAGTYLWEKVDVQDGGGHTVKDDGTAMTQRSGLNFVDFDLTDDSTNDETEIAPHELTNTEWNSIVWPLPPYVPESPTVYAFQIDGNESDPASAVTPYESDWGCENKDFTPAHMDFENNTFDYGSWTGEEFFFPKPCMLKYDGTVDYYLDPDDYTKKEDGTASDVADSSYEGNVMIEFPTVWFKRWQVGNKSYCVISDKQINSDFKAYAHHDVNGDVCDKIYISAYDGSYIGGKLRSISGISANTATSTTANRIMTYTTRQQEINYAKANNVRTDCEGWNVWHKAERDMVNDLLILLGMSLDTQGTFGRGRDTGYVSTSNTGMVSTGSMNTKGMFWGENAGAAGVKVFGIENWWGNLWKNCIGWVNASGSQLIKMTYGKEDGSTVADYNLTGSGYVGVRNATPAGTSGGYISKWIYSKQGLIPYQASGSDATYLCDGLWFNNSQADCALVGGSSYDGLLTGAFSSNLHGTASTVNWALGASLSYKPLAQG